MEAARARDQVTLYGICGGESGKYKRLVLGGGHVYDRSSV
jgi:hypothetical protein